MGFSKEVVLDQVAESSVIAVPVGTLLTYGGDTAPESYLICQGQLVSKITYAELFAAIGHKYNNNVDPGSNQFRLPSNGRVLVGHDSTQTEFNTVGKTGGAKTVALSPAETPLKAHNHSGTTGNDNIDHSHAGTTSDINLNHTHSGSTGGISANHVHFPSNNQGFVTGPVLNTWPISGSGTSRWIGQSFAPDGATGTVSADHGHSFTTGTVSSGHTHTYSSGGRSAFHQHSITTGNPSVAEANGTAHVNLQPYQVVTFIIRYQ